MSISVFRMVALLAFIGLYLEFVFQLNNPLLTLKYNSSKAGKVLVRILEQESNKKLNKGTFSNGILNTW
ncbi:MULTISPECIES: hypothetical protein [unclassified Aliivibrio]|uniref:hypothetical protein n=1 Tax=unclassified Aliivibrio TaxID=2645654 RepID=UPI00308370E6